MTKVGEGGIKPKPPEKIYHHDLHESIRHFEKALRIYLSTKDLAEKERQKFILSEQTDRIRNASREIHRLGIHKLGETFHKSFLHYMKDSRSENLAQLRQDLSDLREYDRLPDQSISR